MTTPKARLLRAIEAIDDEFYGVTLAETAPNGDTADCTFWYARNEQQVVLLVAGTFTQALAERVCALVDSFEAKWEPEGGAGFGVPVIALPEGVKPALAGYEFEAAFELVGMCSWYVWRTHEAD